VTQRDAALDRLRGFALLGIVVVNAPFLLGSVMFGSSGFALATPLDELAALAVTWLFMAKSYVIFAFVFGYGAAILFARATRAAYLRRMVGLALLGIAHGILLFNGDILLAYGVIGALLLALRRASDPVVLGAALGCFLLHVVFSILEITSPDAVDFDAIFDVEDAWGGAGFGELFSLRWSIWPDTVETVFTLQGGVVGAMFCLGLVCGRHRLLGRVEDHRATFRRIRTIGLAVGLPLQLVAAWLLVETTEFEAGFLLNTLTSPILSAGYVAAIALIPRLPSLELAGQMSLSVYLAQSLLLTVLASGWGLGLYGADALATLAVSVAVYAVLVAAAGWWSRRFALGPAEAPLRAFTYWRPVAWPRRSRVRAADPAPVQPADHLDQDRDADR
jgi:uncharacterized protein